MGGTQQVPYNCRTVFTAPRLKTWHYSSASSIAPRASAAPLTGRPAMLLPRVSRHARRLTMSAPSLLEALQRHHQAAATREVAWFVENMPSAYFRQVGPASQVRDERQRAKTGPSRVA